MVGADAVWSTRFRYGIAHAAWHWEYVVVAVVGVAVSRVVADISVRRSVQSAMPSYAARIRAIGWLLGFGLLLYYPLVVLTKFNEVLPAHGGLFAEMAQVPWEWRVLVPAIGGLLAGLLVQYVTPESGGHGVTEVIEALNANQRIPPRVSVWKSITSGLVIGSGGSAGREGPVVRFGGAVASGLGDWFGLSRESAALPLLACGGGAGIAASFNSPIGGTFFAPGG